MRTFRIAALALLLTGCATRYVTVPCVSKNQAIPAEPPKVHDRLTGEADKDATILGGALIRWQAYGIGLRSIIDGCSEH